MKMKGAFLAVILIGAAAVSAHKEFPPEFAKAYELPKESKLYKVKCLVCHTALKLKDNPLNPYGKDLKAIIGESKVLTKEALKKIEQLDSDKDGVKNIDEIKDGTLPGDPKSKKGE